MFKNDKYSNTWVAHPGRAGFTHELYIKGLKLRTNTYPTGEALTRGRDGAGSHCRRCNMGKETVTHILGECLSVQGSRMLRHNKICAFLKKEGEKKEWRVLSEHHYTDNTGRVWVPDLVFYKANHVIIIDVAVCFERAKGTLAMAGRAKVVKYLLLREHIACLEGASCKIQLFGFPVGARGKWPLGNFAVLSALGLSKARKTAFARLVSSGALLASLDVMRDFFRERSHRL